ncbi:MAG: hypothetical protein QM727_15945 [Niabella sp.]
MKQHLSISHFTGREKHALLKLKNKIVALYNPRIIYLVSIISSTKLARNCFDNPRNKRHWSFSCSLVLILKENLYLPENAVKTLLNSDKDCRHIHLVAHPFDFVEKQLNEHSLFFCWIQSRAILLYDKDNSCRKLPEPIENMKKYEKEVHQFFSDNPNYEHYKDIKLSPLPVRLSRQSQSSKDLLNREPWFESFKSYLEYHHPKRVNKNIRAVLLDYIRTSQAGYPINFK